MHTLRIVTEDGREFFLNHNSDWSGETLLREGTQTFKLEIPAEVFVQTAAEILRARRIERLEQATTEELLK
jgi:hypothetical protein